MLPHCPEHRHDGEQQDQQPGAHHCNDAPIGPTLPGSGLPNNFPDWKPGVQHWAACTAACQLLDHAHIWDSLRVHVQRNMEVNTRGSTPAGAAQLHRWHMPTEQVSQTARCLHNKKNITAALQHVQFPELALQCDTCVTQVSGVCRASTTTHLAGHIIRCAHGDVQTPAATIL